MNRAFSYRLTAFVSGCAWMLMMAGSAAAQTPPASEPAGAVYTMTNATDGNQIAVFSRASDGTLTPAGTYPTRGLGTGAGLGNQGGLVLSDDQRWLYAVNAGSNDITVFSVGAQGLTFVDKVSSGGMHPISMTASGSLVYVLNSGSDSIAGFVQNSDGRLFMLPASSRPLSGADVGPAQIQFSPGGAYLVVTEKNTNMIDVFDVGDFGYASFPSVRPSSGETPFGFGFGKRGQLFVSEAFSGGAAKGALTSYNLYGEPELSPISASVPDDATSPCWVVVTADGRWMYVTNAVSNTISSYRAAFDGSVQLANTRAGLTENGPVDMALSADGRYLYALNGKGRSISLYRVESNGDLTPLRAVEGASLPAGVNGLAAR